MVVEDGPRRLAVECDGEKCHPLSKLPEDMTRQAVLERLGWRFIRIRGSKFFRNPDQAMAPVLERLNSLGIGPVGRDPSEDGPGSAGDDLKGRVVRRAEELRKEWEELGDDMLASRRPSSAPRFGRRTSDRAAADVSGSKGRDIPKEKAKGPDNHSLEGPERERPRLPPIPRENREEESSTPPPVKNQREAPAGPARMADGHLDVVESLRLQGLEVIDKRPAGGALWVVGGAEIGKLLEGLKAKGYRFSFAKSGGKATKNRPAWFAK